MMAAEVVRARASQAVMVRQTQRGDRISPLTVVGERLVIKDVVDQAMSTCVTSPTGRSRNNITLRIGPSPVSGASVK